MWPPDSLSADLWDHLHFWLRERPGRQCHWVMSIEWLNHCRHLDYGFSGWAFMPRVNNPETILGLPVDIREQDDRPGWMWRVPHLEPA